MDSLHLNLKAVAVDEAYLGAVQGSDVYRYGYYPHNVHFVLTSAQMAGERDIALEYAHKLDALVPFAAAEGVPLAHPVKAAVYYALAQFADPAEVLAMPQPPATLPYVMMAWRYARALAHLELGQMAAAEAERKSILALADDPGIEAIKAHNIPGRQVIALAAQVVEGKRQAREGKLDEAIATFQAAAEAQTAIPYTEPPFWYYPVEQTLGALLLQTGRHGEAAGAFMKALVRHPNNAWSLYGLMKAQEAAGDPAAPATAALYAKATSAKSAPPIARF
jgi:tetratricopeptide (TPR) repeat protein